MKRKHIAQFVSVVLLTLLLQAIVITRSPAQLSTGIITGTVPTDRVDNIHVMLLDHSNMTLVQQSIPGASGEFIFRNVPFAAYNIRIVENNVVMMEQIATLNSAVPLVVAFDSVRHYELSEVTVEAPAGGFTPTGVTTHSLYTSAAIGDFPAASGPKTIEAILLNTPGVVPDEDGRLHIRGEDAQLQYVVDGIPITGNLTRVYASLFNAQFIKAVDVQTGGLNAEYGVAASGILAITTKSGFDRPFLVHASGRAGSFNTGEGTLEIGGNINNRSAIYLAGSRSSTDRYLDPITSGDPNHDNSEAWSYFGKFNTIFSDAVDLGILGIYDHTKFSIPSQFMHMPPQDQRQDLEDYMAGARLNAAPGENALLSVLIYHRSSRAKITSGGLMELRAAADIARALQENEKFFIGGDRKYTTTGGGIELSMKTDWFSRPNTFKAGASAETFPVKEFLTFAVTNPSVSNPDSVGGDDRLLRYDITRGGSPFLVDQSRTGNRFSAYVQDAISVDRWTINAGVRFDAFKLIESENAVSPRVGASYAVNDDLVLRVSYSRIVMQAPLENYLVSSSPEARALVGAEQGNVPTSVRSEKAHVLEIGGAYRLNRFLHFDLAGYGKFIDDFIVKVELGNSGVIFPVNLKQGIAAGGELRVRLNDWNNLSGSLSVSTCVSRGRVPDDGSSPFAAGLVLGEEGESYSNPFRGEDSFPTEHDQLLTASFTATYRHPGGAFATLGGRFDSGLPFDLVGPNGEALNAEQSKQELKRRGYTDDVIDLLELEPEEEGSPDRGVAPHVVFDAQVGYEFKFSPLGLKASLGVLNVFDTPYLYKFESTFGGTHFGQPRTVTLRLDVNY